MFSIALRLRNGSKVQQISSSPASRTFLLCHSFIRRPKPRSRYFGSTPSIRE